MSRKRKPRKRLPRELRRPPTDAEAMDIAKEIFDFAAMVANRKSREAVDALREWIGEYPIAELRSQYLATVAPLLAMALVRKHFPVDMEPDEIWVLEQIPDAPQEQTPDGLVMAQILVRYLNDDTATAHDLIEAHRNTYGPMGLFWVGVEAIKFMAGVLIYANSQGDAA